MHKIINDCNPMITEGTESRALEEYSFDTPRISVLMTVYNAAGYVVESIDSIIAQSFKNWELIVVDDGSTDASLSILADYTDPRVRLFSLPQNIGRTPALRYAFDITVGEYIAVLDSDDISHPERLARQVAFLDKHSDVALVGSWVQYINEQGIILAEFSPPTNQDELHDCLGWIDPIVHSSAMFRRSSAMAVGGYPEHLVYAQDFGLILALAQHYKIAMIDDFLCQLRILPNSMTTSSKYQTIIANDRLMNLQLAAKVLPLSKKARQLNRRVLVRARIRLGIVTFISGSVLIGVKIIVQEIVHNPSILWLNGPVRRFLSKSNGDPFTRMTN